MSPFLKPGDNVLVWRFAKPKIGDVIVFKVNDKHYVKRIEKIKGDQYFVLGDNKKESIDSKKFGWIDKNTLGTYDFDKCEVKLNVALLVIETFLHEYHHYKYPNAKEREVIQKNTKKMNRLTRSEMAEVGNFIFETLKNEVKALVKRKAGEK